MFFLRIQILHLKYLKGLNDNGIDDIKIIKRKDVGELIAPHYEVSVKVKQLFLFTNL